MRAPQLLIFQFCACKSGAVAYAYFFSPRSDARDKYIKIQIKDKSALCKSFTTIVRVHDESISLSSSIYFSFLLSAFGRRHMTPFLICLFCMVFCIISERLFVLIDTFLLANSCLSVAERVHYHITKGNVYTLRLELADTHEAWEQDTRCDDEL